MRLYFSWVVSQYSLRCLGFSASEEPVARRGYLASVQHAIAYSTRRLSQQHPVSDVFAGITQLYIMPGSRSFKGY